MVDALALRSNAEHDISANRSKSPFNTNDYYLLGQALKNCKLRRLLMIFWLRTRSLLRGVRLHVTTVRFTTSLRDSLIRHFCTFDVKDTLIEYLIQSACQIILHDCSRSLSIYNISMYKESRLTVCIIYYIVSGWFSLHGIMGVHIETCATISSANVIRGVIIKPFDSACVWFTYSTFQKLNIFVRCDYL